MDLDEVSAKIRTGPPIDDEEDYELPVWAGVVPVETVIGRAEADGRLLDGVALPCYLKQLKELLAPRRTEEERLAAAS
jgi:hypothetical protein